MASNPPWADKLLNANWDAIQAAMQARGLPLEWLPIHEQAKTRIHFIEELGCGHYGCVYETDSPGVVCKVTTDVSEAAFIGIVKNFEKAGELLPSGLVKYFDILALEGKRGKRDAFILWREEAFGFEGSGFVGLWDVPKDFLPSNDPKGDPFRINLWRSFKKSLSDFLAGARLVREVIQRHKKRMGAEEYWDWVENQFRAVDEHWGDFNEVLHGGASAFSYFQPRHPLHLAFKLFLLFDTAMNMTNEQGSHYIGEAFQFFLNKKIVLADVHLANVAFVNRDDGDFSSDVPIIVDPGHAVFLSREFAEVPMASVSASVG